MKFIKWKSLIITCVVCLLPILLGVALWERLPDTMAIHFNINNEPDNFASKTFVVFGLPLLMALLQIICCFINDINAKKHGERKKFERATKWIIPVMTVVLQIITLGFALGWQIDIRRAVAFLVGMIFFVIGNYLPKFDYVKNYDADTQTARKINRFLGFETVVMGALFLISILLPSPFTVACIILLIPYTIIGTVYGVVTARKDAGKK
ncbi:MAG: DUF1648 domain-containing protein [Oscillospiraceae bacterium]|nr:DUF1648 domain-containing protein [Oscillospiraceae bacterium]